MTLLALALTNAAFAQNYGISNDAISTCNFATFGSAVAAAKVNPGSTVYATAGNHSVPGVTLDENMIIQRGSSNCTPGGTGVAVLDFNNQGSITVRNAVVIMYDMVLREGNSGNLNVAASGDDTAFYGVNVDFLAGASLIPLPSPGGNVSVSTTSRFDDSTFYCDDCTFDGGVAGTEGGGLFVGHDAQALLYGDIAFTNNVATTGGGAIFVDQDADAIRFPGDMVLSGNLSGGVPSDVEVAGVKVIVD